MSKLKPFIPLAKQAGNKVRRANPGLKVPAWYEPPNVSKPTGEFNKGAFQEGTASAARGEFNPGAFEARDVHKPSGAFNPGGYKDPEDGFVDGDPWGAFYFSLEIDKTEVAQFLECSGLKTSTEVFEIEEGGNIGHTHKRPGRSKWDNVVLKRGVSSSDKFVEWRDEYLHVPDGGWLERKSAAIVVRSLDGDELRRYTLNGCWPLSWEGPQFNAGGSDLAIESLEISHEGIRVEDARGKPGVVEPPGGEVPGGGGGGSPDEMDENEGPRFNVGVIGMTVSQAADQGLAEMVVEDHLDMLGSFRASFNHTGVDWSKIKLGDNLNVGFGGADEMLFTGIITGIRHFNKSGGTEHVEIQGLDPMVLLASSVHTRFWEDMSDSDIASDVLGQAGVELGTVDSTSVTHKYVMQRSESDLVFLRRLAARNGYILDSDFEGKVEFKKPQFSGSAIVLARDELIDFDYTVSVQGVAPSVTVVGWDYVAKEVVSHTASSGDVTKIGGGDDSVSFAGAKIWQDDAFIGDLWVTDASLAEACAVAELNRMARSLVRGFGVVAGRGDIRAGAKIAFEGFADGFNPEGVVVGSRHRIEDGMYTTEFFFVGNTAPK